jgi:hypothetical protein
VRLTMLFRSRKSRKYPIQRDQLGKTLRTRCFELFDKGERPLEIARILNIKKPTVQRYFRQWKKIDPNFDKQYAYIKEIFKKTAPDREKNVELFAQTLGIEKEQFEAILSQSHGLRRFLMGKLYFPVQGEADHKLHIALVLALLIADHLVRNGGKYEDVYTALEHYMAENQKDREEEEADVKNWNQLMPLIHKMLAVELEQEQKEGIKPDTLSKEERDTVMRMEMKKIFRETQTIYWARIVRLMAEGNTEEQAREKIYQDVLAKGDPDQARKMREFQDKVHPLEKGNQAASTILDQSTSVT